MDIDLRSLTSLMTLSSTSFLYRLPFLLFNPSIQCGLIPHPAVPRSAKALIISHCPHCRHGGVVSTSFKDALPLDPTNCSALMLMNETLRWSSSSSMTNIFNRQPSVSVDLRNSLNNAKLNPSELESQAETEVYASLRSRSRKNVSAGLILV